MKFSTVFVVLSSVLAVMSAATTVSPKVNTDLALVADKTAALGNTAREMFTDKDKASAARELELGIQAVISDLELAFFHAQASITSTASDLATVKVLTAASVTALDGLGGLINLVQAVIGVIVGLVGSVLNFKDVVGAYETAITRSAQPEEIKTECLANLKKVTAAIDSVIEATRKN